MENVTLLIKQAQTGDEKAFATLYKSYHQRIYRYVFSRVGDQANAEELTSQTFLAVLEGLPGYRDNGKFNAWIFKIAQNKVMDFFRTQKKLGHLFDEQFIAEMTNPHYVESIIEKERAEALAGLITQFSQYHKELLRLRFVADLTYREIAELTNHRTAAVKKAIYRLLNEIRDSLEKDYE